MKRLIFTATVLVLVITLILMVIAQHQGMHPNWLGFLLVVPIAALYAIGMYILEESRRKLKK
jgi:uncharacterized membrane protein